MRSSKGLTDSRHQQPELGEHSEDIVLEIAPSESRRVGPNWFERLMDSTLGTLVPVVGFVLLWEAGSALEVIDQTFFPAPHLILTALADLTREGVIVEDVSITLQRLALGFVIGTVPAVVLGVLMARVRWIAAIVDPLISVTYPVPMIAVLPLLLVIFGLGSPPIIALSSIICFYPAVVSTLAGVRQVDERLVQMAQNMGASRRQVLWKIALPGALPSIFAGLRLGVGLALLGAVAGEFIAASEGIGARTWRYWQIYQITNMYATLVVIATLGFTLITGTLQIEKRLFNWSESSRRRSG